MATLNFVAPPNPRIQENGLWQETYPTIEHDGAYLRNKYTGEIVPNNPDHAMRSDILEPISDEEVGKMYNRLSAPKVVDGTADMGEF